MAVTLATAAERIGREQAWSMPADTIEPERPPCRTCGRPASLVARHAAKTYAYCEGHAGWWGERHWMAKFDPESGYWVGRPIQGPRPAVESA
jgi:hypothetical protein